MPGVEVVRPVWPPSSNGHLRGMDGAGHEPGVMNPPTWSGPKKAFWPNGSDADQYRSHVALDAQYDNNRDLSSHLGSPVDDMAGPEMEVKEEPSLGLSGSLREQRVFKPHKALPRRRHFTENAVNLRSQFNTVESESPTLGSGGGRAQPMPSPSTPVVVSSTHSLLPTPPSVQHEVHEYDFEESSNADTAILRSRIVTPVPQQSPPTPDHTPPRLDPAHQRPHFLGTQPSLASTKAESFQTAREHASSEDEDEALHVPKLASGPQWLHSVPPTNKTSFQFRPSPLAPNEDDMHPQIRSPVLHNEVATPQSTGALDQTGKGQVANMHSTPTPYVPGSPTVGNKGGSSGAQPVANHMAEPDRAHSVQSTSPTPARLVVSPTSWLEDKVQESPKTSLETADALNGNSEPPVSDHSAADAATGVQVLHRGQSLRERLEQSQKIEASPSTERFGDEIGWSRPAKSSDLKTRINSWRLSGISTTSTVEAIVVDREPKRQQTLRHRGRNASLRSASSPIPASNRTSLLSNPDSPPRLHHKKARLSNQNRWSFGSEISPSLSMSSAAAAATAAAAAAQPKSDIIHVAVIPERMSSLKSSANSSKRHSAFSSAASGGQGSVHTDGKADSFDLPSHRRAVSDSFPAAMSFANRGRDRRFPPTVPARSSSLSASTSKSNSRANSITSEHLRLRRVAAEEDVRKTLARMESKRTVPTEEMLGPPSDQVPAISIERDPDLWANMRPPSAQQTPFSQQSFNSTSPGAVEMGEARAVNLFPHNNHSLQIIESNPLPESRAVQELHTSGRDLQLVTAEPATPVASLLPMLSVDSPLRNPRDPPKPPQFKVIPPTPASLTPQDDFDRQLGTKHPTRKGSGRRFGSLRRPAFANRRYSESFIKPFGRTVSLNAKNKKADQDLDGTLHPFWRPRGFWDEFSDSDEEGYRFEARDRGLVVNNSLGMPQKRTIIDGPLSLVRKISDGSRRRRQNARLSKRTSYSSLSRFRMGRKVHKIPGLGLRFQVLGLRDLQQRMLSVKRRKEDERRDRRREELRKSIGPNVISQGDSRYISPRLIEPSSGLTPEMD